MADRLVSADRFKNWLMENYVLYDGDRSLKDIDAQPTVDAVPVVRCKDCKWYYQLWIDRGIMREHCRRIRGVVVKADGFCSWGERREDAKTD